MRCSNRVGFHSKKWNAVIQKWANLLQALQYLKNSTKQVEKEVVCCGNEITNWELAFICKSRDANLNPYLLAIGLSFVQCEKWVTEYWKSWALFILNCFVGVLLFLFFNNPRIKFISRENLLLYTKYQFNPKLIAEYSLKLRTSYKLLWHTLHAFLLPFLVSEETAQSKSFILF